MCVCGLLCGDGVWGGGCFRLLCLPLFHSKKKKKKKKKKKNRLKTLQKSMDYAITQTQSTDNMDDYIKNDLEKVRKACQKTQLNELEELFSGLEGAQVYF